MNFKTTSGLRLSLSCLLLSAALLHAQGVRDHTRLNTRGARVSGDQAADVTLTLSKVETRSVQQIVRAGGTIDQTRKILTATLPAAEGRLVKVGQRARGFPPESKSSMYQARVTRVAERDGRTMVEITLSAQGVPGWNNYVMEITAELGDLLCVPSEAIIEEGDHRIVYVQEKDGDYVPRVVETGVQGELYTEVRGGVQEGEQVVTFGSFFIDSEYKLKLADRDSGR
ncbi:MAG TPA: hypothetical protein VFY29_16120 [Terriglobia bacterium]|nr:hypothetical protein [Terriglobia bacterium]